LHFTSYNSFIVLEHSINRGVYNGSNICGPILERFGGEIPPMVGPKPRISRERDFI
jgi:hypothetical protein